MAKAGRHSMLKSETKALIYQILEKNPGATITKIHEELEGLLIEKEIGKMSNEKAASQPDFVIRDGNGITHILEFKLYHGKQNLMPTISTLTRYLKKSEIREKLTKCQTNPDDLDIQWSVGVNKPQFNFPPNEIPLLLEYKKLYRRLSEHASPNPHTDELIDKDTLLPPLTVRKALWLIRLRPVVIEWVKKYEPDSEGVQTLLLLSAVADLYARNEQRSQLLGDDIFDSSELDNILFETERSTYQNFILAIGEAKVKTLIDSGNFGNQLYVSELITQFRKSQNLKKKSRDRPPELDQRSRLK